LHVGWSFTILVEELLRIYRSHLDGRPPGLPELTVQFADYAAWQHDWLRGDEARRQLGYWRRHLAGAPARLTIPADRPRPAVQSLRGATVRAELTAELTDGLRRLAHTEGATLFVAMLAVFEVLMHRYTGSDDLVIGSGIANRHRPETERLIGMLVNNIALRVDASGDPTFRVLLGRVRETALGAYAHQDTPFEQVVEELQPDRDHSHNPLFQVSFAFHDSPMPLLVLPRVSVP